MMGIIFIALLRFVPRTASRTWATGLLIVAAVWNLGGFISKVVSYYNPNSFVLHTEKNELEFSRTEQGDIVGVRVHNPPAEYRSLLPQERPWSLTVGNLFFVTLAWLFLRRSSAELPSHGTVGPPSLGNT
jgi:hypothetical protein